MANKLKSFDETRAELNRIGIARFYHNAVTRLLLRMFDDIVLIDAYLLGERLVPKYGTKTIKNKTVKTVKFYPESRVRHVIIFEDEKNGKTKIDEAKNG